MKLLDLSARNRLLNFRHSDRARSHVRVIDELPDILMQKLLAGRPLRFRALPEPEDEPEDEDNDAFLMALEEARETDEIYRADNVDTADDDPNSRIYRSIERALKDRVRAALGMPKRKSTEVMSRAEFARSHGLEPEYEMPKPREDERPARHDDDEIQTLLFPAEMERKLSGLAAQARTNLQETGVNTLYFAFGFLEWYESEDSDRPIVAPLLLQPLEIERVLERSHYKYLVRDIGEETETNITLSERLAQDFNFRLPRFEENDTPESYLAKISELIHGRRRWRVRRYLTVGHFAFARTVMYHDLDPARWPDDIALHTHPAFAELFGGSDESRPSAAPQYETDDAAIRCEVPLLVTDADSSQFSALVDIMRGGNLAIEGPPGTGKSQTITNAIAAAMAAGKSVLFIAEKMAALEVVKSRLDGFGLGPFVLELHSTKARKHDVLAALRERLDIQHSVSRPPRLEHVTKEIEGLHRRLRSYVELINSPFGELQMSIHDILWNLQRARDASPGPNGIEHIDIPETVKLDSYQVDQRRQQVQRLAKYANEFAAAYGSWRNHPWYGVRRGGLSPFERQEIIDAIAGWRDALGDLTASLDSLALPWREYAENPGHLEELMTDIGRLPDWHGFNDIELIGALGEDDAFTAVHRLTEDLRMRRRALEALSIWVVEPESVEGRSAHTVELKQLCASLQLADFKASDLNRTIETARENAVRWGRIVQAAQTLTQMFGADVPLRIEDISPLVRATELAAGTDRATLEGRTSNILAEDAAAPLAEGLLLRGELRSRLEELQDHYHLPLDELAMVVELRAHAEAIDAASAGPVALRIVAGLRSSVREAKRRFRALSRKRRHLEYREIASELRAIADIVEDIDDYTDDKRLRSVAGEKFSGIDTDFERLLAVNAFGREVRQSVTGPETSAGLASETLLSGPIETLDRLRALTSERAFHELREIAEASESTVDPDLRQAAAAHAHALEEIEWCQALCEKLTLKPDTDLSALPEVEAWCRDLDAARARIESNVVAATTLGGRFAGSGTDLDTIADAVMCASAVRSAGVPALLARELLTPSCGERLVALQTVTEELRRQIPGLAEHRSAIAAMGIDLSEFLGPDPEQTNFTSLDARLEHCLDEGGALSGWTDFYKEIEAAKQLGLGPLVELFEEGKLDSNDLEAAFDRAFFETMAREAYRSYPELAEFRGIRQEEARQRFQKLDRQLIDLERGRLRADLCRRDVEVGEGIGPKRAWTGLKLIENELSKKRRHVPIRDLLDRSGPSIQQMKPCFMMSPLSVAQFLKPKGLTFDLVVIDEASQMKPEFALGALARGRQVIVVGDPMQLPPTSFFDRFDVTDEEDDESEASDVESILDLAMRAWRPYRRLLWHYRSRHQSLIAFSNNWFYDSKLIVFPSPNERGPDFGVGKQLVREARYKGRMNVPEARAIAEAAVAFMRSNPDRSLGLVAMNQGQGDLIRDELSRLIARDAAAAAYVERWENEENGLFPLFVKNLENVQGDERDVIYISTTYGPDGDSGKVMQRFGPINSPTGHRRLNVLFTRAREQVRVFTSLSPSDVQVEGDTVSRGRRALRDYLEYAGTGRLEVGEVGGGRGPESPFEEYVKAALERRGYEVVPQVGVAGYFIDLGIRDPAHGDSFLCGIECDGASYHSAKSVRDRDRLRQEVLENLGWRIYRIWSTDWFDDQKGEMRKLEKYLKEAMHHGSRNGE